MEAKKLKKKKKKKNTCKPDRVCKLQRKELSIMFYKIRIIETLEKEFEIEAKSEKEALEKIQIAYDNEEVILYPENLDHKEMKIVGYKDTFIEEYETIKRAFYDYYTSYILLRYGCLEKAEKRLIDLEMIVSVDKYMNE
ncbi:hypothetical protein EB64_02835 [Enterococcus faecium]|uniref:DpnD/PcfM family protein n=1 Tax=Enterococcus faecium TaxID=1352 RepID=UPI000E13C272|nr:DpnD/PcfM family protein [Enterococcus faecium]RBS92740.1 hypothetical protein EB64_02835 [Enterococcus faecium]